MSIIIGLTGPTGAGKSSATKAAEKLGFQVIDCDLIARQATKKGTDGLKALTKAFGRDILLSDGSLNRLQLARKAFSSKENTELLNKTVLPFIVKLIKAQIGDSDTVLDAPTLFESGLNSICYKTIAVLASKELRMQRIISRDQLTINDANIRLNAGKSDDYYKEKADYLIYNNADAKNFYCKVTEILKNIKEEN